MNIEDLEKHCKKQLERLPKTSQMYEEHLLILAVIETNKEYLDKLEKKDKVINEMATTIVDEGIFADRCQCKIDADECDENCEKCIMEHFINKVEREGKQYGSKF